MIDDAARASGNHDSRAGGKVIDRQIADVRFGVESQSVTALNQASVDHDWVGANQ